MDNKTDGHSDRLVEIEYAQLGALISQGYQVMALLLTLYFIFNGAMLTFFSQAIASNWGNDKIQIRSGAIAVQWKDLIIFFSGAVAILFTFWSIKFVEAFSANLRINLERGAQIEAASGNGDGVFSRHLGWLNKGWSRRGLAFATSLFFLMISALWLAIMLMSLMKYVRTT